MPRPARSLERAVRRRPWPWLAAAVLAGTLAGRSGQVAGPLASALLWAAVLGALWSSVRGGRSAWIGVVALAALGRALPLSAGEAEIVGRWVPERTASADGTVEGHLRPRTRGAPRYVLPEGTVRPGERVAFVGAGLRSRSARGPYAPARAPRARVELLEDEVVRLAAPRPGPLGTARRALEALRRRGLARAATLERPATRGLCAALLYGDRSRLPLGTGDLFTRTGTQHLLSVSGLHVGLVAVLLLAPLAALGGRVGATIAGWRAPRVAALLQVLLVLLYVPLAGGRPPVVRAALACALALVALQLARRARREHDAARRRARFRPDALSLWSFALLLECLADPDAPGQLSVQLSYSATLGLIVGYAPLARALAACCNGGRIAELDRRGRPRAAAWRVPAQRLVHAWLGATAASLAAVLATLPWAWPTFGELSPWGVVATPWLVPLVVALLAVGFAHAFVPALCAWPLDRLTEGVIGLLELVDRLPASPLALPPRPTWLLLLVVVATYAALRIRTPSISAPVARAAAAGWAVVLIPWACGPRALELWALDVGGGTAVVLRAPGTPVWIFDAGSRDRSSVARASLAPLLAAWESTHLAVVLSHHHRDHGSALRWLVERYPPELWAGALPAHLDERLPHATPRLDLEPHPAGGALEIMGSARGSALRLSLLRGAAGRGNEGSRSLLVGWGGLRLLLSGDAEAEGLDALIASGALEGPLRLLLAPHHGSQTPWLGPLLAATRPQEVWISGSGPTPIGPELERRGLRWRSTARDGPLGLTLEPRAPAQESSGWRATGTDRAYKRSSKDPARPARPEPHPSRSRRSPRRAAEAPPGAPPRGSRMRSPLRSPLDSSWLAAAACLAAVQLVFPASADALPRAQQAQEASPTKSRRSLVHLNDGRVLRVKARQLANGSWEVRGKKGWSELAPGTVERVRTEKDVLAELERLSAGLDPREAGRRVELIDWMLAQGLTAEAVAELNTLLTDDPAQPAALALIARSNLPVGLPQSTGDEHAQRDALLTFGAKATPLGRALVVNGLAELDDQLALRAALIEMLGDGSLRKRSFAAVALGRLFPGDQMRPLLVHAVLDSSEDVRRDASHALRSSDDVAVILPVVRALGSASPTVRANAAESLGHIGHAAAVAPLMTHLMAIGPQSAGGNRPPHSNIFVGKQQAYIQDFDVEVAQRQAVADPQIGVLVSGAVLDVGVHSVHEYAFTHERKVTRHALRRLTGADPGNRTVDWKLWWEENQSLWRTDELERKAEATTRAGGTR